MGWRRIAYLLSLAGCAAFYLIYRKWLSGLALTALVAFPWFSLAASLPALFSTRLRLELPAHLEKGQSIRADLLCSSKLPPLPIRGWLKIKNTLTGEIWDLKPGEALPTDHCGQLEIAARGCRVYDYLGLFRFPIRKKPKAVLLVRPAEMPLAVIPNLHRLVNRVWRPKRGGGFGEHHELRLYRPGDNLQQIHWKLTAKTGKLILRETVEPERGRILVKLDLSGTDEELDRKLGRCLWLCRLLLQKELPHELRALTGAGLRSFPIGSEAALEQAMDTLLACPCSRSGTIADPDPTAAWEYYIGGDDDEA